MTALPCSSPNARLCQAGASSAVTSTTTHMRHHGHAAAAAAAAAEKDLTHTNASETTLPTGRPGSRCCTTKGSMRKTLCREFVTALPCFFPNSSPGGGKAQAAQPPPPTTCMHRHTHNAVGGPHDPTSNALALHSSQLWG
jgi:hypothetical protein